MFCVFPMLVPPGGGVVPLDPRVWGTSTYLLLVLGFLVLHVLIQAPETLSGRFLSEFFLVLPAALLYFLVRGLTHADPVRATEHAHAVVALEQRLGFHLEPHLQGAIIDHAFLVRVANWIYVWGHWPVIFIVFVWLWKCHPDSYPIYRNALLISGAIGIVIFALYPVAPPRLVAEFGLVDTVTEQSRAYRLLQPPSLANQYAAMPSLHFGWNLIVGVAVVALSSSLLARIVGILLPAAMFAAIVLTANHYLLDGIVGAIVALTGLKLSLRLQNSPYPDLLASGARSLGMREDRG